MRYLLVVVALLFGAAAFGTQITASGGSPIPASYSTSDTQSKIQACDGNVVEVQNETATKIGIGFGTTSSAPGADYKYVPAGPLTWQSFRPKGGLGSGTYIYVKSMGSAITAGTLSVSCTWEDQQ